MVPASTAPSYRPLLSRPGYPGFVLTVSLARVSAAMFNTAGVLLVLVRTHSAALAGVTAAATVIPGAVSGPLLGAWLDVVGRRRLLVVGDQLLSVAGLMAMLALAGHAPNWTVPVAAVLYSVTRPFSSGSFSSALVELAGDELLDAAGALEATSLNLAVVIGPALAGVLSGVIGPAATVEVQIALTLVVALLIVGNPAFDARPAVRVTRLRAAVGAGLAALVRHPVLRATAISSTAAAFGLGLMLVGFPLYAVRTLHAPAHAGGYLWAALAAGSIIGTFGFRGRPSLARSAASYLAVGLSALLWLLGASLAAGVALIMLSGVLEGPAWSGAIALRQRHAPAAVRAQVMTTLTSLSGVALAAGGVVGGLVSSPETLILLLAAVNLVAAVACARERARAPTIATPA